MSREAARIGTAASITLRTVITTSETPKWLPVIRVLGGGWWDRRLRNNQFRRLRGAMIDGQGGGKRLAGTLFGCLFMSLLHQVHKRGKVIILVKDVAVAIAPIQDMVNKPTL